MNKKKVIAMVLLLLAVALGVYWWLSGASIWTLTEIPMEVKDEMFDTTSIRWEPGFRLGLEYTAPAVAGLGAIAAVLLWLARREGRRLAGKHP